MGSSKWRYWMSIGTENEAEVESKVVVESRAGGKLAF